MLLWGLLEGSVSDQLSGKSSEHVGSRNSCLELPRNSGGPLGSQRTCDCDSLLEGPLLREPQRTHKTTPTREEPISRCRRADQPDQSCPFPDFVSDDSSQVGAAKGFSPIRGRTAARDPEAAKTPPARGLCVPQRVPMGRERSNSIGSLEFGVDILQACQALG